MTTDHTTRRTRVATDADLPFLLDLQRRWSNNVGFLPTPAFQRAIDEHRILVVDQDAQPAAYLMTSCGREGIVHLNQVAIEAELLRTTIGTKIVRWLDRCARRGNCSMIRLRCRNDLPANAFWPTAGFTPTGVIRRPSARGRLILEWTKQLTDPAAMMAEHHTHGRRRRRPKIDPPSLVLEYAPDLEQAHPIAEP